MGIDKMKVLVSLLFLIVGFGIGWLSKKEYDRPKLPDIKVADDFAVIDVCKECGNFFTRLGSIAYEVGKWENPCSSCCIKTGKMQSRGEPSNITLMPVKVIKIDQPSEFSFSFATPRDYTAGYIDVNGRLHLRDGFEKYREWIVRFFSKLLNKEEL